MLEWKVGIRSSSTLWRERCMIQRGGQQPTNQNSRPNGHSQNQNSHKNGSQAPNRGRQNASAGASGGAPARLKSSVHKVIKCAICDLEQHKTYQCPVLLKLDLNGRIRKIRDKKLCENCLRPNCHPDRCTLRSCINPGCDKKHNRLVCEITFQPSVNNGQSVEEKQA